MDTIADLIAELSRLDPDAHHDVYNYEVKSWPRRTVRFFTADSERLADIEHRVSFFNVCNETGYESIHDLINAHEELLDATRSKSETAAVAAGK